jgi:hypothetical protein
LICLAGILKVLGGRWTLSVAGYDFWTQLCVANDKSKEDTN